MRESGCSEVEGMCVMKYSWKQRRWRAYGAIDGVGEGYRETGAQAAQAIDRRRLARGSCNEGFHMLSLAAKEAWCGSAGSLCHGVAASVGLPGGQPLPSPHCRSSRNSAFCTGNLHDWPAPRDVPLLAAIYLNYNHHEPLNTTHSTKSCIAEHSMKF
jgi:hypothetical protein